MKKQFSGHELNWNPLLAMTGIYIVSITTSICFCLMLINYYKGDSPAKSYKEGTRQEIVLRR